MTINSVSGNFQLSSQEFSGRTLPDKTETIASKPAVIAPVVDQQVSKDKTTETSIGSAAEIAAKLNENVEQLEINDSRSQPSYRQNIQRSLRFQVDDITGGTVIRVIDRQTDETIRQIPSEELLILSRRLNEINDKIDSPIGVLVNLDA